MNLGSMMDNGSGGSVGDVASCIQKPRHSFRNIARSRNRIVSV